MATVDFRVAARAHIVVDSDVCRSCTTQACVTACPANLFAPTADGGHPLQLRGVLRVRDLLHGLQPRGRHHLDLPRRRPGRRLPPRMTTRRCRRGRPLVVACLRDRRSAAPGRPAHRCRRPRLAGRGLSAADAAALEHALRIAEAWCGRVLVVTAGPAAADEPAAQRPRPSAPGPADPGRPVRRATGRGRPRGTPRTWRSDERALARRGRGSSRAGRRHRRWWCAVTARPTGAPAPSPRSWPTSWGRRRHSGWSPGSRAGRTAAGLLRGRAAARRRAARAAPGPLAGGVFGGGGRGHGCGGLRWPAALAAEARRHPRLLREPRTPAGRSRRFGGPRPVRSVPGPG